MVAFHWVQRLPYETSMARGSSGSKSYVSRSDYGISEGHPTHLGGLPEEDEDEDEEDEEDYLGDRGEITLLILQSW